MIPPMGFITEIIQFISLCLDYFEWFENSDDSNMEAINMSFLNTMQILVMFTNLFQLYIDEFFASNREWDAHRIISYLLGYRYIITKDQCNENVHIKAASHHFCCF